VLVYATTHSVQQRFVGGVNGTMMLTHTMLLWVFVGRSSTLNYAMRAKRIQNKPVVQVDPKEQLIMNL